MMAAGGTQLKNVLEDDGDLRVEVLTSTGRTRRRPSSTGPEKIAVAPYHYLCDGQLTNCVPQPGTDRRLDAQGDKIMARLVYRKIGNRESIVGGALGQHDGGRRRRALVRVPARQATAASTLYQQGTYAPDGFFRWMASPAIDRCGNIGIGYSFGGPPHFAGQRFAGRLANDPPGQLTLRETVLVEGEDVADEHDALAGLHADGDRSRPTTARSGTSATTSRRARRATRRKIGAFRMPGCR